ncbi:Mitochondrial import inner membrane translocase subunit tim23 [Apophysomyces sp. BC1034]|nr:Mitochondrial import inner membrane translocase subunit tim23 [Apophysomyces sp. BC1015]KAG0178533.1 Mitochondrial import inner membrane translocase subunit tim23 [Apophysomyces sp. BC1021]KAG0188881.1 Mitochondrial import inner membrane translocase subunit tim23 [Apophysomyces sp. BC1034]
MGIFGFGSTSAPANNTSELTSQDVDDIYSPSGNQSFSDSPVMENSYEQMPDFLSDISYDSTKLQPMALQGGIDFLQIEDQASGPGGGGAALTPSRGWTDDLCYGTGATYLAGLTLGGAFGLAEGLRRSASAPNARVRLNTTLNTITRRGPGWGNAVGVVAMMYNGTTAMIDYSRGKHDMFNSIAGGAISGAIFKSTAGPRAALMASAVCGGVAGAWSVLVSLTADNF